MKAIEVLKNKSKLPILTYKEEVPSGRVLWEIVTPIGDNEFSHHHNIFIFKQESVDRYSIGYGNPSVGCFNFEGNLKELIKYINEAIYPVL